MKIYNYDPLTKVYTTTEDALPDPGDPSAFIIPAHATTVAPPVVSKPFVAVFESNGWVQKEDNRQSFMWEIATGNAAINNLQIGDPLPQGFTLENPVGLVKPLWDGSHWVENTQWIQQHNFDIYIAELKGKFEEALRLVEDDVMRGRIPGLKVMSAPHFQDIENYLLAMDRYISDVELAGPSRLGTLSITEPVFPLTGGVSSFNMGVFDTQARAYSPYTPAIAWRPNERFEAGQLVYGTNGEGLYVVVSGYVSHPQMSTDITAGDLVPAMPNQPGLRYAPVNNLAELAALAASDYAICKVKDTGFEYVFHLGLMTGDVPDNNSTGFWNRVASGSGGGAGGNFRAFEGQTATASPVINVGIVGFTVSEMLVFVNGSLRLNTEYTYDAGTGEITLNAAMQPNDTWKVLLMS